MSSKALLVLAFAILVAQCQAGPLGAIVAYGACQTACNAGYVTCCTAAGATAGTFTLGIGIQLPWRAAASSKASAWLLAQVLPLLRQHHEEEDMILGSQYTAWASIHSLIQ
nr:unnamed protein product [Callosobruchus analis]